MNDLQEIADRLRRWAKLTVPSPWFKDVTTDAGLAADTIDSLLARIKALEDVDGCHPECESWRDEAERLRTALKTIVDQTKEDHLCLHLLRIARKALDEKAKSGKWSGKVASALLERAEAAEAKVKALEEVVEAIRALNSKDALLILIDEAHAPRSHPDYPDRLVERHSPTAYIEGYTNALLKVTGLLNSAALSRLQATEGEDG